MIKFKPGDKVICINDENNDCFKKGKIYTICDTYGHYADLKELLPSRGFFKSRFKLAEHYDTPLGRILYK